MVEVLGAPKPNDGCCCCWFVDPKPKEGAVDVVVPSWNPPCCCTGAGVAIPKENEGVVVVVGAEEPNENDVDAGLSIHKKKTVY